jgi:hypothetical protein
MKVGVGGKFLNDHSACPCHGVFIGFFLFGNNFSKNFLKNSAKYETICYNRIPRGKNALAKSLKSLFGSYHTPLL